MVVVGKTEDGKLVMGGLGKMYFETGLPLSIIFDLLKENDQVPSWIHLIKELMGNGMKKDRVIHLLSEHIFESYGKEYRDIILNKLETIWQKVFS